ncbi:MAG: flagella basal body P-ring formation protein FlgA [Myxococcales bacterium]|nr:flagella basal body P-ring formation protein FlgA [Myxococcales bacterium]MDD9965676.1 flagella basal body P-ring formation protein FlgA [Myxococcales bacterium]
MFVFRLVACLGLLTLCASAGQAQDRITAGEVMPSLRGGPHSDIVIAPAPTAGSSRIVRRRDVRRALRAHGVDLAGLRIPRQVRISRAARDVEGGTLLPVITEAVAQVVGPCTVERVRVPRRVTLGAGEPSVVAEPPATVRDGTVSIALELLSGAQAQRLIVSARLSCPPPVVGPGDLVRVTVRVGAVLASAPGRARQAGRVGEVIRVVNTATGARLSARVVDHDTVEVVR